MISFGQTIARERSKQHLSQIELAALLNEKGLAVKPGSVSKWEKDVNRPNVQQFFALCEILKITDINATFQIAVTENPFAGLNHLGQAKALEYIDLLKRSGLYTAAEEAVPSKERTIRLYDLAVSAGTGEFLDTDSYTEWKAGPEVPALADFGVRIAGDSMTPHFVHNQTVWVQRQDTLEPEEIGIFALDGQSYCKRLHKDKDGLWLVSLNPQYPPLKVCPDSDFKILGKVVG